MEAYGGGPIVECERCGSESRFTMGNPYSNAMTKKLSDEHEYLCSDCEDEEPEDEEPIVVDEPKSFTDR